MKKSLFICLYPTLVWAVDYQPDNQPDDRVIEANITQHRLQKPVKPTFSDSKKAIEINEKELLNKPALLKRAMQSVLLSKQIDGLAVVLPIYQKLPDADTVLIDYGQALLAQANGQLNHAIDNYRRVIAKQPTMSVVRLDLATALYANRQVTAARDQLVRLQSEALPDSVAQFVKQTIEQIDREEDWQFGVSFYYRQEDNINNAPKQRKMVLGAGTLTFPEPEKAHGVHLALGAKKRFNLGQHLYGNLQLDAVSDYYWDNHAYDDLSLRAGIGLGYQNARLNTEIQPFVKKRFYGTKPYSLTTGASGLFSYRLTPRWKLSNHWEWSYEDFEQRKHLNGQRQFVGLSGVYIHSPQQYWSVGINYYNNDAKHKEDSYHRTGAFIGWGQEWQGGISSNLTLSASKRNYGGVDFFNIKRSDKEYAAKLSLWHRGIHYRGITPRLQWSWNKTHSNHFYYNNKENTINIVFSNSF